VSGKKTKTENLLAGSTAAAPDGVTYSESMKHGDESPGMLLALLNSTLESLLAIKAARVVGTINTISKDKKEVPTTILFIYNAVPTANGTLKPVGNEEK